MSSIDGRYFIRTKSGRLFVVQPVRERDQRENDIAFRNGGVSGNAMKRNAAVLGGALSHEEADAAFAEMPLSRVWDLPTAMSPDRFIEWLESQGEEPTVYESTTPTPTDRGDHREG